MQTIAQPLNLSFQASRNAGPTERLTPPIDTWNNVVQSIAAAVSGPLSQALERVKALMDSGKIDRVGLLALGEEIAAARRAGMVGQQIARLASSQVPQSKERIYLTSLTRDILDQRIRADLPAGLEMRKTLASAEIEADPSLVESLIQTLVDWSVEYAKSAIEFRLQVKPWPHRSHLSCRFHRVEADLQPHCTEFPGAE